MTRRKTDPMAQAIRDLRYLPRVLEALKALRAKDAEVMALVGGRRPLGEVRHDLREAARGPIEYIEYTGGPPTAADLAASRAAGTVRGPVLPTPERQEYEAAKKAGKTIPAPDPFEGQQVSEAQRERMARQKAWLESQRVPTPPAPTDELMRRAQRALADPVQTASVEVPRTEELTTVSDGTAPVPADGTGEDGLSPIALAAGEAATQRTRGSH